MNVPPALARRVRCLPVQFHGEEIVTVEVVQVAAAAGPGDWRLAPRRGQAVRPFDTTYVPVLQRGVRAVRDVRQRGLQFGPVPQLPARPERGTEQAGCGQSAPAGLAEPLERVLEGHRGLGEIDDGLLDPGAGGQQHRVAGLPDPARVVRVETTDPYTLGLLEAVSTVPLDALTSLTPARRAYAAEYGLLGERGLARPLVSTVYPAEALALRLEQSLPQVREQARLLHPLIVLGLTDPPGAQLFALALAAGEIVVAVRRGDARVQLVSGDMTTLLAEVRDVARARLAPLVQAYLGFFRLPDDMRRSLMARYDADPALAALWRAWVEGGWSDSLGDAPDAALHDLILACRLLVTTALE